MKQINNRPFHQNEQVNWEDSQILDNTGGVNCFMKLAGKSRQCSQWSY